MRLFLARKPESLEWSESFFGYATPLAPAPMSLYIRERLPGVEVKGSRMPIFQANCRKCLGMTRHDGAHA
jgi:hypothetical protein